MCSKLCLASLEQQEARRNIHATYGHSVALHVNKVDEEGAPSTNSSRVHRVTQSILVLAKWLKKIRHYFSQRARVRTLVALCRGLASLNPSASVPIFITCLSVPG